MKGFMLFINQFPRKWVLQYLFWQNPAGKDFWNWHCIVLLRALSIFIPKEAMLISLVINYLNEALTDKSCPLFRGLTDLVAWLSLEQFPAVSSCNVCFSLAAWNKEMACAFFVYLCVYKFQTSVVHHLPHLNVCNKD